MSLNNCLKLHNNVHYGILESKKSQLLDFIKIFKRPRPFSYENTARKYSFISNTNIEDEINSLPEYVYAGKNIKPHVRVYVMGIATHGGLGLRNLLRPAKGQKVYKHMSRPCRLSFADNFKVQDIACGYGFSILSVKTKDGPRFYGTGVTNNCQIGYHSSRKNHPLELVIEPSPIDIPLQKRPNKNKISCGRAHSMIWTDEEGLWTFGNNSYGQCGRPVVEKECYTSVVYHNVDMFNEKSIEQLECGQDTSFVLSDGKVYSCGWSADGQTGRGTYQNVDSFGLVEGDLKSETVVKLSSRADCVLALTDKGEVFGWGNSEYRQLGRVTEEQQVNVPRKLDLSDVEGNIIDVAATGTACFVLTDLGEVWSWGFGILGVGPSNSMNVQPSRIPKTLLGATVLNPESKVVKLFAGISSMAAITDEGGLYSWGRNVGGCLGLGHTNFQHFPMRVCVASTINKVSCGVDHMFVMGKSLM